MKAAIAGRIYDIIEYPRKVKVPKIEDGKVVLKPNGLPVLVDKEIIRIQLVSPERTAQREFEHENGITSSRQRRKHKTHRFRGRKAE